MDILLDPVGFSDKLYIKRLQESSYQIDKVTLFKALGGGYFNVIHLPS